MSLLADSEIAKRVAVDRMISPCDHAGFYGEAMLKSRPKGAISSGLTSYGYDMTLDRHFKVFRPRYDVAGIVDPKHFDPALLEDVLGDHCVIPPNSFALGRSVETFSIPRDILVVVVGKSTYARCGIGVTITPLEPEWKGVVTIEIANHSSLPAKVYAGEGIAQLLFFKADIACAVSYADKKGRYQGQTGITAPRVG